jgi:hypothetical protein
MFFADVVWTRVCQSSGKETHYNGITDCTRQLIRTEGIKVLGRGWLAQVRDQQIVWSYAWHSKFVVQFLRVGPHTCISFVTLEKLKELYYASHSGAFSAISSTASATSTELAPAVRA